MSGKTWGLISLGAVAYVIWGYSSLLKENERRESKNRGVRIK